MVFLYVDFIYSMKATLKRRYGLIFVLSVLVFGFLFLKFTDFNVRSTINNEEYLAIPTKKESCFNCHTQTTGFSEYHNPITIGCTSCHLGNSTTINKSESHKGMVRIPGNLSNAANTCGKCHASELHKIKHSLMTTNSGLVAVDKFVFKEATSPDYQYHIKDIKFTAAEKHLRDLCANCHLGAEKKEFGSITQLSRGGGCNACHLSYSKAATNELENYIDFGGKELPKIHPSTDIFVKDEHCFGCHSRSSRISTNYMGWHETLLEEDEIIGKSNYKTFEDGRIYSYQGEDVHHAKGMLCIDCHSSHEVMGNGKEYLHEEKAVALQCADCHFKDKPNTVAYKELDVESSLVFMHRKYKHKDKEMLAVKEDGHPLVNTYLTSDGNAHLISKKDGKIHPIKKQGETCARDVAHKNVACSTCHSQWTPRCIGCHNSFDKNDTNGYDLLDKKEVVGQWVEHVYNFGAEKPAMGVRFNGDNRRIEPAIPGMIMTIDHNSFSEGKTVQNSFYRLYAPNAPHTIAKKTRDCKSCHSNPIAIGYGEGTLVYTISKEVGEWQFTPAYELNPNDTLPEDAWIPFLKPQNAKVFSTRTDFRPFTIKEQKRILLVGACLQCHKEDSKVIRQTLKVGLDPVLLRVSKQCVLPKD